MNLTLHFLDDDYAINRFHQLTLSSYVAEQKGDIQFFEDSRMLLEFYRSKTIELPDVLFLDINMPVLDGWQFLDRFNKEFSSNDTQVVILTTSNNPSYVKKAKRYPNLLSFEIKPLKQDRMMESLSLLKSKMV